MEGGDGLLRVPVNHHLFGIAEEEMQVAAAFLAAVGNIGVKMFNYFCASCHIAE